MYLNLFFHYRFIILFFLNSLSCSFYSQYSCLGYIFTSRLKYLVSTRTLKKLQNNDILDCYDCKFAKFSDLPFSKTISISYVPFDLIHLMYGFIIIHWFLSKVSTYIIFCLFMSILVIVNFILWKLFCFLYIFIIYLMLWLRFNLTLS